MEMRKVNKETIFIQSYYCKKKKKKKKKKRFGVESLKNASRLSEKCKFSRINVRIFVSSRCVCLFPTSWNEKCFVILKTEFVTVSHVHFWYVRNKIVLLFNRFFKTLNRTKMCRYSDIGCFIILSDNHRAVSKANQCINKIMNCPVIDL